MKASTSIRNIFQTTMVALVVIGNTGAFAQGSALTNHPLAPGESERIDKYLRDYMSGVVITKTLTDRFGETLTCVDINHHPSRNHPLLKDVPIQRHPSPELLALLPKNGVVKDEDYTNSPCPKDSVLMILPTREKISRHGSLKSFFSKYPDGSAGRFGNGRSANVPPVECSPTNHLNCHEHAAYIQYVNATAVQATINVWRPTIESWGEFSLTQLWAVGGTGAGTQTVEVGAQVYPIKYWDLNPHIFIYFTTDNYAHPDTATGCYNTDCGVFVNTSGTTALGQAVAFSTPGSAQVEAPVGFWRDPTTGHWWLFFVDGTTYIPVGYYPHAIFGSGQMSTNATRIDFGGEVYSISTSQHTGTTMGSGQFPGSNNYGNVAYQSNLIYMDMSNVVQTFTGGWVSGGLQPNCYNVQWGSAPLPGSSIYFGGPGHNPSCP